MSKNIRLSGIRNESNTNLLKRITCLALASISLASLGACKNKENNNNPVNIPTTSIETQTPTPESTPIEIVIETPAPVEFSYESVFSEIFSNEELAKLYPEIEDYDKERERIYSNISRIEDFEFYQLTEEEQSFIKEAQLGNIDVSEESKVKEVLTKILAKDPHVFDDIDNEVKLDNRARILISEIEAQNAEVKDPRIYIDPELLKSDTVFEEARDILIGNNCGKVKEANVKTAHISALANINANYFTGVIEPDYKKGKWRGNYITFNFYKYLLDGSEGQKFAKTLNEYNVKLFNSEKKDVKKNLKEFASQILQVLLVYDTLELPGGIDNLDSKMYRAIIYDYCTYYVIWSINRIEPNYSYIVPKEFAERFRLSKTKVKYKYLFPIIETYKNREDVYSEAFRELAAAQSKYRDGVSLVLENK